VELRQDDRLKKGGVKTLAVEPVFAFSRSVRRPNFSDSDRVHETGINCS
jgi:hypothetical protein